MTPVHSHLPRPLAVPAALLAAWLLAAPASAALQTQTFSTSFTGAGGDATAGWWPGGSEFNVNLFLFGVVPLFDPGLGTLEKVSFDLSGWRSLDGECITPAGAQGAGSCTARIDGFFHLEAHRYSGSPAPWVSMAMIRPEQTFFSVVSPAVGQTLPLQLLETRSTAGEITDAATLSTYFTDANLNEWQDVQGIVLRFVPNDGGYYGSGFSTFWQRLQWDADASLSVTYHYVAAIPEPGSAALMLGGLGLVGWLSSRRRVR